MCPLLEPAPHPAPFHLRVSSLTPHTPGKYTFFGKAADMINSVEAVGRFQKIVFGITMWLLAASIVLTIVIFVSGQGDGCVCTGLQPALPPLPHE